MKKLNLKFNCEFCKLWLPLIVLLMVGFYAAWQFVPAAAANHLKIAVGGASGSYHDYATQYQQHVKVEGIKLEILSVEGSVEALQKVRDGEADLAMVQGGVASSTMKDAAEQGLHSIASLFYEPLWVFYRKDLGEISHLNTLRGKRLSIGKQGSGTQVLVSQLLTDNDITAQNSTLSPLLMEDAAGKLLTGSIDAMFLMAQPSENVVRKLLASPDIALMDFRRQHITYTSHYPFLASLTLGEGIIDLKNNLPDHNLTMLASTAILVAGKNIHPDHVRLFSREAINIHGKQGLLEKARQFPSIDHLEIPIHPVAAQYIQHGPSWLEKIFPFWLAARIDQLKVMLIPLLTLLIPLSKGIMPLYQWRIRSRIYPWYNTLSQIDRKLDTLDLPATEQAIIRLHKLHGELATGVSVPLGHMPEFYHLRTHTDHILTRLKERRALLLDNTPAITNVESPPQQVPPDISKQANGSRNGSNTTAPQTMAGSEPASTNHGKADAATADSSARQFRIRSFWQRKPQPKQPDKPIAAAFTPPDELASKLVSLQAEATTKRQHQQQQTPWIIRKHVLAGMAMGAIPLPIIDVATLTATQLHLLDSLSRNYKVKFNKKLAKAKLLSLLSSALPTTTVMGLNSLTKLVPGIGTISGSLSLSALSGAVIYATGHVFVRHFEAGGTLENFDGKQQTLPFQQALQTRLAKADRTKKPHGKQATVSTAG